MARFGFLLELLFYLLGFPEKATRMQHRSTDNTDGTMPATHVVGIGKCGFFFDQLIDIGCAHFAAKCTESFVAEIIGKQKQNVRFVWLGCRNFRTEPA